MLASVSVIVVPVDFSDASAPLLRTAINVARVYGAELHLLHVYQDIFSALSIRSFELSEEVVERAVIERIETKFAQLRKAVPTDVPLRCVHRKGETAEEILAYVAEEHADMIVIATKTRTGLEQLFIGSITQRIVRAARCPVLTLNTFDVKG
jgi:nucleotide-binding universal stress UspA family protein